VEVNSATHFTQSCDSLDLCERAVTTVWS
jgi:hypothetical protein